MKRYIWSLFVILLICPCAAYAAIPQTEGITLQNIPVFYNFSDYRHQGENADINCATWGSFEKENGLIPLETVIENNGSKVYRFAAQGSNGGLMFPMLGWSSFPLTDYYGNGSLIFDVMGAEGGEDFNIGLRSHTKNREILSAVPLSSLGISLTDSWQRVEIPIKLMAGADPVFDIGHVNQVVITVPAPQTFYLSDMYISSPDNERQYPVIKVNQSGYRIDQEKYALVSCFPGTLELDGNTGFRVVHENGDAAYTGFLQFLRPNPDKASGEIVLKAEFSSLRQAGIYRIEIDKTGIGPSFPFAIGEDVYAGLMADLIKYYYFQRQGLDLEAAYAGVFARADLHPGDRAARLYSQRNDDNALVYDVSKGWYDAGDFGKYLTPGATSVSNLLWAYELFPGLFFDNQANIPESGNGIADILDEVKWELDFMLAMRDAETGGFYDLVPHRNPGSDSFITDVSGGETNVKTTAATADSCAALAHAYLIYKDIPAYAAFAGECLSAASGAWEYLERNPGITRVEGAYRNNSEALGERFWAAAMMFRAAGEKKYEDFILENYKKGDLNRVFNASSTLTYAVNDMAMLGYINYALCPGADADFMAYFQERFAQYENTHIRTYNTNYWPSAIPDWAYYWGSNGPICLVPVTLYLGNKALGKNLTKTENMLLDAVHYMMGINPLSFSFVSGHGENSVKNIYSGIFVDAGLDAVPPGYVAGGANQYNAGMISRFPAKCYADNDREWTTNEHTIYWNSAFILCLAAHMAAEGREIGPPAADTAANPATQPEDESGDTNSEPPAETEEPLSVEKTAGPASPWITGTGLILGIIGLGAVIAAVLLIIKKRKMR